MKILKLLAVLGIRAYLWLVDCLPGFNLRKVFAAFCIWLTLSGCEGFAQTHTEVTVEDAQTITGAKTFSGNVIMSAGQNVLNAYGFNSVTWIDGVKYAKTDVGLAQAITDNCAGGSCTIYLPEGVMTFSAPVTISQSSIHILGQGTAVTTLRMNYASGNLFTLSSGATNFELGNLSVDSTVGKTAGFIVSGLGDVRFGYYHDLLITDAYGGFRIGGAGGNSGSYTRFVRISSRTNALSAAHAGSFFSLCGGDGSAMSDIFMEDIVSRGQLSIYDAPQMLIDSGCDTLKFVNYDLGYSQNQAQTQPVIQIQNSIATVPPKYIRFIGMSIEAGGNAPGTADCINLVDTLDLDIASSYITNCSKAVNISGGASMHGGIRIHDSIISNNQAGGIYVTAATAPLSLVIRNNHFAGNSILTNNSTDDINIINGTTYFTVEGNHFDKVPFNPTNSSRYGVNLQSGASNNYQLLGNECRASDFGTGCYNDLGSGTSKFVQTTEQTFTPNMTISSGVNGTRSTLTVSDPAGRNVVLRTPDSGVNNGQVGTSTNHIFEIISNGTVAETVDQNQNVTFAKFIRSGNTVRIAADFTTANNTSLQTITGLSWTLPATAWSWSFTCNLTYSQATAAAAVAFGIQAATNSPTAINANGQLGTSLTAFTTGTLRGLASTTATNIVSATPSAFGAIGTTADMFNVTLSGTVENPALANTINIMVSTATGADAVTVYRGGFCQFTP